MGKGQVERIPTMDHYPGGAVVGEGGQDERVSEAGQSLAGDTEAPSPPPSPDL